MEMGAEVDMMVVDVDVVIGTLTSTPNSTMSTLVAFVFGW